MTRRPFVLVSTLVGGVLVVLSIVGVSPAGAGLARHAAAQASPAVPPPAERVQFVLLGIDNTPSARRPLRRTGFFHLLRAINRGRALDAPQNSFTLFIATGGMQLDPERTRNRRNPELARFLGVLPRNQPVIRYAPDLGYLQDKVRNVREMSEAGVEIASHSVRHGRGAGFDEARWAFEMRDNQRIVDLLDLPAPSGFRAPFLEESAGMYEAMRAHGMRYDASRPGARRWPVRHESGIWLFEIPSVPLPGGGGALFFDDNMITLLRERATARGLSGDEADDWMNDAYYRAGLLGFYERYRRGRAPFLVSGHGGMRRGTVRLMRHVCRLPLVRCATFSEATDYLDAHPELAGLTDE